MLVILFVVACLIYFVGGALVLHFLRGAQGLEMIPNIDFWRQLPGLIKVKYDKHIVIYGLTFLVLGWNNIYFQWMQANLREHGRNIR